MIRLSRTLSVLALALASIPVALHADTYNFTIQAGPQSNPSTDPAQQLLITGTLSGAADPFLPGGFDITSITGGASGQSFGYTFTGLAGDHNNGKLLDSQNPQILYGYTFDNVLHTGGGPYTSADGFLVYLTSSLGQSLAHVFATPAGSYPYEVDLTDPNDPTINTPFAITSFVVTPAPVPEPGTLLLLATGLAGGAGVLRRRFSGSKSL